MSPPLLDAVRPATQSREASLARLWLEVEATRLALRPRRAPELMSAARSLLDALASDAVRTELAEAARAFAEGEAERPDAERWVYFAVAARATLDQAVKSGAAALGAALEALDDALEDAREAVLLLEPEDYKEALAATPPNTRLWWGERARLDGGLLEIDLERALVELADDDRATLQPPPPTA
jgi:hypothetical protein